jgi:quercetin dioxygenase-like cupin family protein
MKRVAVLVGLVAALAGSTRWTRAQGNQPLFTGRSEVVDSKDLSIARRNFDPAARTYWHSHDKGQLLFIEQGRARLQRRGEAIKELKAGDSDYTAPNVVHWHGAVPNERLMQINIGFGGTTKWLEAVTDEEYAGRSKP